MIAVAAIDLMDGEAVQLVQGDPASAPIRHPDPARVARQWVERGFRRLHLIDLDAALGRGDNRDTLVALLEADPAPMQVGGGIRSRADADFWIDAGADRIIVGTRAVREPDWRAELADAHPGRVVVAADVRGGEVVTHGWTAGSGLRLEELVAQLADLDLAAVLITDVDREGREQGCDRELFARAVAASAHPILAAGSVTSADDLAALEEAGVAEAVLGMALYSGKIRPEEITPWLREDPPDRPDGEAP